MHIVVLAHRVPYPPNKGEKLRTFHQLEYLVKEGHNIILLSPVFSEQDATNAQTLASVLNIKVITAQPMAKPLRLLRALLLNQSFSEAEFYASNLANQLTVVAPKADAILFTASSLTPYLNRVECSATCIKLIDFMDVDSDKWSQYSSAAAWPMSIIYAREHKLVKRLEKQSIQAFDAAFVISKNEQIMFNQHVLSTNKLQVLGNGIEHDVFAPNPTKPSNNINYLFTGVMDYKPNIEAVHWFVNNCWPAIKAQVPKATFTVAGMNPVKSITQLAGDSQIEITGFVEDIMPFYNKAHIFVAPFKIARGVQNKVLQAMSCAIPVITTELGAEGIQCTANEDIIIANPNDEFTQQCITLANNHELRLKLATAARETILKHYAWQSVLALLNAILSQSVNNRASNT